VKSWQVHVGNGIGWPTRWAVKRGVVTVVIVRFDVGGDRRDIEWHGWFGR
jgi:hypothetical protein